jgi:hypothetical protein
MDPDKRREKSSVSRSSCSSSGPCPPRRRRGLVADRRPGFRRGLFRHPAPDLGPPDHCRHDGPQGLDGPPLAALCGGVPGHLQRFMMLPFIAMFYGLHEWTAGPPGVRRPHHRHHRHHGRLPHGPGGHDPHAGLDRAGSPRQPEGHLLRRHGSLYQPGPVGQQLGTRYLNQIFVIERGQYDELGNLLICVVLLSLVLPILTVADGSLNRGNRLLVC